MTTCLKCGKKYEVPEWPWCPHGLPIAGVSVIDDELEGGPRRFETMGADEPFISTKSEWRAEVARRGLIHMDKHDAAYYARKRRLHDEELRTLGKNVEY